MKEVAIKYIQAGLSCLPTKSDKLPATKAWKGVDVPISEFISHGIAIKSGSPSGNLECIDFDNHFGDAKEVISDFMSVDGVKDIYLKYKLPIQSTVSGGFHLLYRCKEISGNQKLARRPRVDDITKKQKPDVLIETRGEGGYFVAAPTPGYTVIKNSITDIAEITPEERNILLSAARVFNTWVERNYSTDQDKERPSNLFNSDPASVDEMKSALISNGWTDLGNGRWRRPGKKEGISATLGKAAKDIFYNFSSSSHPFDQEHGYTAFQVVGLLKYNGDFKQFARELFERYNVNNEKGATVTTSYQKAEKEETDIDEVIRRSMINLDIPVAKPPVIMKIKAQIGTGFGYSRVFTLGNFSAITGKSKSKKTFLTSMLMSASVAGSHYDKVFMADLPDNRRGVILFDTEQSNYDAYVTAHRVYDMIGYSTESFGAFDLREFSPLERCKIIDRVLEKAHSGVSYVVIDGIADLAMAINDEIEASRVVSLLMKWTKIYNLHITLVIHQNKDNNYATGHLGSAILKKAECIISVTKDITNTSRSEVECDLIRGAADFDKFSFTIDERGLPVVDDTLFINRYEPKERL
jgi:hypothetical protein